MPPEVFTEDEVRSLIAACSTRGVTGHRNRALLAVLWRTGVRISEALELRPHDVDFKNGTVRVRLGKGLKPRTTVLSDLDALPLVERWLEERGKLATVGQGASLFCTLKCQGSGELIGLSSGELIHRIGAGRTRKVEAGALRPQLG